MDIPKPDGEFQAALDAHDYDGAVALFYKLTTPTTFETADQQMARAFGAHQMIGRFFASAARSHAIQLNKIPPRPPVKHSG